MKKLLFALVGFMFIVGLAQAQEDGIQLANSAERALMAYGIDPANNRAKLEEAKQKIGEALNTPEAQAWARAWITKGDIYSPVFYRDAAEQGAFKSENSKIKHGYDGGDLDPLEAFNAYQKGYELAENNYEKIDALRGIYIVRPGLINFGAEKYEAKEYEKAYLSWAAVLKSDDLLRAGEKTIFTHDEGLEPLQQWLRNGGGVGEKPIFTNDEDLEHQRYLTGDAALRAGRNADAVHYFEEMLKKGTDKSEVYESLYTAKMALNDLEGANLVLAEGSKKFPDNSNLLFAEINYDLKVGKLDELTGRLKQAIQREPGNISLYATLGEVYDNLQQREMKANNEDKAAEYFEEARKYYTQVTEKDAQSPDAHYRLGALYFNKAAVITQEMSTLSNSQADLQRYKVLNDQVLTLFDQALPHFQKAESLDPNDQNTLLALSEIYARTENELSQEFKKRLDIVNGGGRNETPYFKM